MVDEASKSPPADTPPAPESPLQGSTSTQDGSAESPSAGEEQRQYWKQDLSYKRRNLWISSGGFLLIICGLVVNYFQVSINTEQLRLNTAQSEKTGKSIRANVENAIVTHVTSLDQVFMRKPELMPYFLNGKPIDEKDERYQEVTATAFMILDVYDLVATQNKHYPDFWDTPGAWDEWIIDVFSTSPILRSTFDKYHNWYGASLNELRKKGQERLEAKVAQTKS